MAKQDKLALINQLKDALLLYSLVSQDYDSDTRDYGLSQALGREIRLHPIEIHLLSAIHAHPGISAQELGGMFFRSKGAISQRIKVLFNYGFITKTPSPDNHRINRLYTTESGALACLHHAQYDQTRYQKYLDILQDYSPRDVETCTQIILLLTRALHGRGSVELNDGAAR